MDLRRLRFGDVAVGLAGALLVASLFLPWYGFEVAVPAAGIPSFPAPDSLTGWETLSPVGDVVLLLAGLGGVALVVLTATQRTVAIPIALAALVTLVAIVGAVVVAVKLTSLPAVPSSVPDQIAAGVDAGRRAGVWLAAAAVVLEVVGGMFSMRDERLSRPGRPTDVTGRPIPPAAPAEPLPAPRPGDAARRRTQ